MKGLGQILFLTSIFFLNFMARIVPSPLLPKIEADLQIDHTTAGSFFLAISTGYFIGLMGSGFISSRITHRGTIVLSAISIGLALIAISMAHDTWSIWLTMLLIGLAAGLYLPSGISTLTSIVDRRHWGKALAIHELAPNLSFVAAPLVAESLMPLLSWKGVFIFLGLLSLVTGLIFAVLGKGGRFYGKAPGLTALKALFREPGFWIITVMFGFGIGATLGIFTMLPLFLVTEKGIESTMANTLVSFSRISGIFVALVAGVISDRFGSRRTIFTVFLITGLLTICLGVVDSHWGKLFLFLQPVVAVGFFPPGFTLLSSIGPESSRNVAVSFAVPIAILLGGGLLPLIIGLAGDLGSFGLGIALTGGMIFIAAFLTFLLKIRPS